MSVQRKNQRLAEKSAQRVVSKLPGTRMGTLEDWRQGGKKSLTGPNRRSTGHRDGR